MREGWVDYKFKDVASAVKGKLPKNKNEVGIGIPYLTANFLRSSKPDFWIENLEGAVTAEDGDCLILWDGAGAGDLFSAHRGVVSSTMAVVTTQNSKILREFLTLFISSKADYIKETCRGTTVPHVSPDAIANMDLKIPPLPEQKRIVDLISSVDSYIEALQQQLESAKNSKSAYVNTIVTAVFARGKKTKIADIAEVKGGKRLPKGTPWSEEPTDHRYIRVTDIKDGVILTENLVYVPDDVWPLISRYVVNQGDVVITIAGTIGQVGVIPDSLDGVNLTENAAKIVVDRKLVRSNYLGMLLGSSYYQQDIDSKTKKTTQPKLGLNMINSIEIPLPELAEQDEIFSVVSQIDTLIASTNDLIMQTITLRSGLLSDLLSGEHEIPPSYDKVIGAA
jgi:type I restriction enzyme S subunit